MEKSIPIKEQEENEISKKKVSLNEVPVISEDEEDLDNEQFEGMKETEEPSKDEKPHIKQEEKPIKKGKLSKQISIKELPFTEKEVDKKIIEKEEEEPSVLKKESLKEVEKPKNKNIISPSRNNLQFNKISSSTNHMKTLSSSSSSHGQGLISSYHNKNAFSMSKLQSSNLQSSYQKKI